MEAEELWATLWNTSYIFQSEEILHVKFQRLEVYFSLISISITKLMLGFLRKSHVQLQIRT